MNLRPYLEYTKYLLKHKYYVSRECFKRGLYWQGIIHDWQKFKPSCFIAYAGFFNIDKEKYAKKFKEAWLDHIHCSPHHWQYWLLQEEDGELILIDMPDKYIVEMICDWIGASISITGKIQADTWYKKNYNKIKLSDKTRLAVDYIMYSEGFRHDKT